jgi:S1-C subfamily serine protease
MERLFRQEMLDRLSDDEAKRLFSLRTKLAQTQNVSSRELDPIGMAIQNVLPSICSIWVKDGEETWNGSGFLITAKHVVTASHVVEDISPNAEIFIAFEEEKFVSAVVLNSNPDIDTAILALTEVVEGITPLQLCPKEEIMIGEEIAVIGSPAGWHDIVTVGRISGTNKDLRMSEDPSFQDIILIDADIEAGSSGSAVINIDGKVVGIVMALIGTHAESGIGQRAVSPAYKIQILIQEILNS